MKLVLSLAVATIAAFGTIGQADAQIYTNPGHCRLNGVLVQVRNVSRCPEYQARERARARPLPAARRTLNGRR